MAITFDDGPSAGYTEEILEVLRKEEVRASFFVNGWALEENLAQGCRFVTLCDLLGAP